MSVHRPYILFLLLCFLIATYSINAQSISATYNAGDIPTSFNSFDPSCNGPSTTLTLTLPAGDNYTVTGIDVAYQMTALGSGFMSHQRSAVYCQNTDTGESTYSGAGDSNGTFPYSREGVNIANGTYTGGTQLVFEMRAWRTFEGTSGCNTAVNRVNAVTWTITVYFGDEEINPKVGVQQSDPRTTLDVQGKLTIGDDTSPPVPGTIRWNAQTSDFEGFNGESWMSFTRKDSEWGDTYVHENQQIVNPGGADGDYFGVSIAVLDEITFVGSSSSNIGVNENQGEVTIFERAGDGWVVLDSIFASDGQEDAFYGTSLSAEGDYLVVGAHNHNVGGNTSQGQAYVYHNNGSAWQEQEILTASIGEMGDQFASSVDISGDYLIAGAHLSDAGLNPFEGRAFIFNRNGSTWQEQAILTAPDGATDDFFGYWVAISDYYCIVSSPQKTINSNLYQGKVYIFKRTGANWDLQAELINPDGLEGEVMGVSVDIDGDYAVVGIPQLATPIVSNTGKVFIYHRNGANWELQETLTPSDGTANDLFGWTVKLSGNRLVVGSPGKALNGNPQTGRVYFFEREGQVWVEKGKFSASDGVAFALFGSAVGISEDFIGVGAPAALTGPDENNGKVYFFKKE